jgi:uncharacterized membrane protein YphA (DoxX/SURF4 family)
MGARSFAADRRIWIHGGYGFMEHGFAKLSRGPESFAAILHGPNVPAPQSMAWVSILTEILGGAAILLGAFVVLASVPMAILLLTAVFTVHLRFGFSSIKLMTVTANGPQFGPPGYESICCTWLAWRPWFLAGLADCRSTTGSQIAVELLRANRIRRQRRLFRCQVFNPHP